MIRPINVFLLDLAPVVFVICGELLMDDDRAWRTWKVLPREEIFNVEGSESVVQSKWAVGFLLSRDGHYAQ